MITGEDPCRCVCWRSDFLWLGAADTRGFLSRNERDDFSNIQPIVSSRFLRASLPRGCKVRSAFLFARPERRAAICAAPCLANDQNKTRRYSASNRSVVRTQDSTRMWQGCSARNFEILFAGALQNFAQHFRTRRFNGLQDIARAKRQGCAQRRTDFKTHAAKIKRRLRRFEDGALKVWKIFARKELRARSGERFRL